MQGSQRRKLHLTVIGYILEDRILMGPPEELTHGQQAKSFQPFKRQDALDKYGTVALLQLLFCEPDAACARGSFLMWNRSMPVMPLLLP